MPSDVVTHETITGSHPITFCSFPATVTYSLKITTRGWPDGAREIQTIHGTFTFSANGKNVTVRDPLSSVTTVDEDGTARVAWSGHPQNLKGHVVVNLNTWEVISIHGNEDLKGKICADLAA